MQKKKLSRCASKSAHVFQTILKNMFTLTVCSFYLGFMNRSRIWFMLRIRYAKMSVNSGFEFYFERKISESTAVDFLYYSKF